jgi:phosphate:Na+ symporter
MMFGQASATSVDTTFVVITMAGGLALFLLGLEHLSSSLKLIAGDRMRGLLARLTTNRVAGMLTGAGVTAVIQSSSVTTVLVVGFISSGVMTLTQSVGVIIGANVGTTVTAQVIAFKVTRYALALVAAGFAIGFFAKGETRRLYGTLVMGLGLVFFGMLVMSDAMEPLRDSAAFIDFLARAENPLLAVAVAALFTAVVQSSSATTGVVIVLATQGLVSLEAGIALILGANVGTAVTALLAAIGKPREALRAAVVHALFNVLGVLLWIGLIGALSSWVQAIGGNTARQVANAHTMFNIVNALVFIGFTAQLARAAEFLIRDRPDPDEALVAARYLDTDLITTPELALDRARLEVMRMANRVRRMLADILPAVLDGPGTRLREVEGLDDEVDALHGQIIKYLGRVSETKMSERTTTELISLMEATNAIEAIGDVIETNLVNLGLGRIDQQIVVSDETRRRIEAMHDAVLESFDLAIAAMAEVDLDTARTVRNRKALVVDLEQQALEYQAERLMADEPKRGRTYRFEIDVVHNLTRIHYFARRVARTVLPIAERATEGADETSSSPSGTASADRE